MVITHSASSRRGFICLFFIAAQPPQEEVLFVYFLLLPTLVCTCLCFCPPKSLVHCSALAFCPCPRPGPCLGLALALGPWAAVGQAGPGHFWRHLFGRPFCPLSSPWYLLLQILVHVGPWVLWSALIVNLWEVQAVAGQACPGGRSSAWMVPAGHWEGLAGMEQIETHPAAPRGTG